MEMLLILILALLPPSSSTCLYSLFIISSSSSFPSNCRRLEGRFRVDDSSDLADSQLVELFANVRELHGVVQIWNSRLTTANFLANIRRITGDLLDNSLSILNNTLLTSINLTSLEYSDGKVEIQNNPLLDLKPNCPALHKSFFNRRSISSLECGCELTIPFLWPQIKNFPDNCSILYGNLIIDDVAPPTDFLYRLLSVRQLYGFLEVRNTNLETLGFLQNLEEIEAETSAEFIVEIHDNEYLRRLDLIHLKFLGSSGKLWIEGAHLCIDPSLAQIIMHSDISDIQMFIEYCPLNFINNPSLYCTGKLSELPDNCTRYIGDIAYENMDNRYIFYEDYDVVDKTKVPEEDIRRIQKFDYIFGNIYIEGSALHNLTLPNLKEIYANQNGQAITLSYNSFLSKIEMPKLRIAYQLVQLIRNKKLVMDQKFCKKIKKNVKGIRVAKGEETWLEETFC